jgi:hypothetical protein
MLEDYLLINILLKNLIALKLNRLSILNMNLKTILILLLVHLKLI